MRRFSLALTFFIFLATGTVLLGLVLYPPLPALAASLASPQIRFAIGLSLVTSTVSTAICVALAIPAAYALARYDFPLKKLVNLVLTLPLALPPLVAGIALLHFLWNNGLGKSAGNPGVRSRIHPAGNCRCRSICQSPVHDPDPQIRFFCGQPAVRECGKDARMHGDRCVPPGNPSAARPGLVAGTTITWAKSMGEFGAVLMLAGATTMRTETLPIALYLNISTGDLDLAVAASVILIMISLCALAVVEHYADDAHVF